MKFLIDAQLPVRLARLLRAAGADVVHTRDLPDGNRTSDAALISFADDEDRVVVTKDADFVDSHLLTGRPRRLLLVSTGNISNAALDELMTRLSASLMDEFERNHFLEIGLSGIIVRD